MKKAFLKRVISVMLSLFFCFTSFCGALTAFADMADTPGTLPETEQDNVITCSVTDFGADGSDEEDDVWAFRDALAQAVGLKEDEYLEVEIPAGRYYLDNNVPVYSNTVIKADENAEIISRFHVEGPMLIGVHLAEGAEYYWDYCSGGGCTHGGYSQTHNVTITGGVWDRGADISEFSTSVFSFRHASDITIKNLTVQNTTDHMINISGTKNALLENVTLRHNINYTNDDKAFWGDYTPGDKNRYNQLEAIHLDYCNKAGENSKYAQPYDNTPVKNVKVTGCTFEDVYAGVGTHHAVADEFRASDVTVTNNTMNNIRAFCVFTDCFDNVLVSGNTAVSAGCFARFNNSKVKMQNNKLTANTKEVKYGAVYADAGTNLTATGNTLSGAGAAGITLKENCVGTVQNNTVENTVSDGFSVLGGSSLTAKNNTVTNSGTHGFYIDTGSKAELVSNTVKTTQGPAVQVNDKSTLTAKDNTIDKSGKVALYCSKSSKLTATGNTITNSVSSGIQVSDSSAAEIKKNTVSKAGGKGIHILKATGCVIEGNKVTASKNHAVMVEGVKGNPGTATVKSNTLDSSGGKDLRLGAYALNCTVGLNTLKHNTFSVDATATYTQYFLAPKLTGISNSKTGITVKWNKSGGAAKYRVLRKTAGGTFKKVADVSGNTASYTDKSAKSGTKYTYTVRCISADGKKSTSDYDKTGKTLLRLSAPTLKKATPVSKKITVTWGKVAGAKGYYVYRKTGSGKYSKVATVTGTSYADKKVTKGKKYTYTVYAYNGSTKSAANTAGVTAKAK